MDTIKPGQVRIRIQEADMPLVDALKGKAQSRSDVASVLVSAALDAIRRNKGRVYFWPPLFEVVEEINSGSVERDAREIAEGIVKLGVGEKPEPARTKPSPQRDTRRNQSRK